MSRWFRVDDGLVDDPKVQQLSDRLFRAVVNLWCVTSQNGGNLPDMNQVAFKLRISGSKADKIMDELREAGLIDDDQVGTRPHNWNGRQFKSDVSTDRVQQFRERRRNVSSAVSETPPETEQKQKQSRAEKEEPRAGALPSADDWPSDFREQFWDRYPNKVGKPTALKKLEIARKSGHAAWPTVMAGLEKYIAKTDDRPWCNPATWVHQQRWTDQPAQVSPSKGPAHVAENRSLVAAARKAAERFSGTSQLGDQPGEPVLRLISESGR